MALTAVYPSDPIDKARWERTRLLYRILMDLHKADIQRYQAEHLDPSRLDAWGPPTVALNPLRSVIDQLAVMYDRQPIVTNVDSVLTDEQWSWFWAMQPFRLAQRHQVMVLGLRESLLRIAWAQPTSASPGGIDVRMVTADNVVITAASVAPSVPLRIEEAVCRVSKAGKEVMVWDVWDIQDPARPTFSIQQDLDGKRRDVTNAFIDPVPYPYVDPVSGQPYLPYVLYHAASHGGIWDVWSWGALVAGTMDMSLLAAFWIHSVKSASWIQKYGMDAELQGLSEKDVPSANGNAGRGVSRQRVATDPASILMFRSIAGDRPGSVSTLQAPSDPKSIIEAIQNYAQMIAESSGFTAADVEATSTQSGVAIQIRRDALRRIQKRYEPLFAEGDEELLQKIALIANLFGAGPKLPTTGWRVSYPGLPFSREEEAERLTAWEAKITLGVASRVDLLMETKNMSREEASVELNRIASENRVFTGA